MFGLFKKKPKPEPYINKEGYRKIYKPNHHRANSSGYVSEHVVVAEKKYGRPIDGSKEHIHHKNGNKLDNRKGNLKKMSPDKHREYHNKQRIKAAKKKY